MIHYQLVCQADHSFDGWFRSSADFDAQAGKGLISCPVCGETQVGRALMAPAVAKSRDSAKPPSPPPSPPPSSPAASLSVPSSPALPVPACPAGGDLPDQARAMLQKLRSVVERHCENVGDQFPDQVRGMHYGDIEKRGIYGEASPAEVEALSEEGIEIALIPWVPLADS